MVFVAENYPKGIFEPIVDRERQLAATIGVIDTDYRLPIVLFDIDDLDKIGIRNEQGKLTDLPAQPDIALSAILAEMSLRLLTDQEKQEFPEAEEVVQYTFYGSPGLNASTPYAPGCDWEQSKAIYQEIFVARYDAQKRFAKSIKNRIHRFR